MRKTALSYRCGGCLRTKLAELLIDLHFADHTAKLVHLLAQNRVLSCGARTHSLSTHVGQSLDHIRVAHSCDDLIVQAVDDVFGRFGRRKHAVPAFQL